MAVEVEFRDGWKTVPDHVEAMLTGIETHKYTYDQAIRAAEKAMLEDHILKAQQSLIQTHFRKVTP